MSCKALGAGPFLRQQRQSLQLELQQPLPPTVPASAPPSRCAAACGSGLRLCPRLLQTARLAGEQRWRRHRGGGAAAGPAVALERRSGQAGGPGPAGAGAGDVHGRHSLPMVRHTTEGGVPCHWLPPCCRRKLLATAQPKKQHAAWGQGLVFDRSAVSCCRPASKQSWHQLHPRCCRHGLRTAHGCFAAAGRSPKQPSAAVLVGALEDAYVTRESIRELSAHWPGSRVRWVPGGHVSAFLLQQPAFRQAIADSLAQLQPASS